MDGFKFKDILFVEIWECGLRNVAERLVTVLGTSSAGDFN